MKTLIPILICLCTAPALGESAQDQARILFETLTGVPLMHDDPRLGDMAARIQEGAMLSAASVATADDNFYDVTLKHWASHLSNRDEFQNAPLNDFVATIVGHTAEPNADARELLTGDFWYEGSPGSITGLPAHSTTTNAHYKFIDDAGVPLRTVLTRRPQRLHNGATSANFSSINNPFGGLLSTRAWAVNHLSAGTNRRAVEFAFREFMCTPIKSLADNSTPREWIRQDVHRNPGGSSAVFDTKCASCHGLMDGLAGAFAYYDFVFNDAMTKQDGFMVYARSGAEGRFVDGLNVAKKMRINAGNYSAGYVTQDNAWVNYARFNQNEKFGWRTIPSGNGVGEFGALIANSEGFSNCMAKRVYSQLCLNKDFNPDRLNEHHLAQLDASDDQIKTLARSFENNGYELRRLFQEAAVLPKCLKR